MSTASWPPLVGPCWWRRGGRNPFHGPLHPHESQHRRRNRSESAECSFLASR